MKTTHFIRFAFTLLFISGAVLFVGCNPFGDGDYDAIYYRDKDGDGFGDPGDKTTASLKAGPPAGYVKNCLDCYDNDPSRPGDQYKRDDEL